MHQTNNKVIIFPRNGCLLLWLDWNGYIWEAQTGSRLVPACRACSIGIACYNERLRTCKYSFTLFFSPRTLVENKNASDFIDETWPIHAEVFVFISSHRVFMSMKTLSGCPALAPCNQLAGWMGGEQCVLEIWEERISKERALLSLSHTLIFVKLWWVEGWKPKHKHMFEQESEQLVLLPVLELLLIKQVRGW